MDQTLEELRAENAAAEASANAVPQAAGPEAKDEAAAGTNTTDDLAEGDEGDEGQQAEPEDWMKGDDQESQKAGDPPKEFTHKDIAAAKVKLKATIDLQRSELEELKAQLEAQRSKSVPQPSARPKREDFYEHDDPDDAYAEALMEWKLDSAVAQKTAANQQYEQQRKQLEVRQKTEAAVEQHYERAAELSATSGIPPELYRSADLRVREAIQGVYGGESGEHVTNALIAKLGEGSEKVMYKLGISQKALSELTAKLRDDPDGLQAAIYLGKLSAELSAPARKKSNAPAPATDVQGNANTTDAGKGLQRKYQEAHKRGDVQAAFSVRREAKAAGINTNSW